MNLSEADLTTKLTLKFTYFGLIKAVKSNNINITSIRVNKAMSSNDNENEEDRNDDVELMDNMEIQDRMNNYDHV